MIKTVTITGPDNKVSPAELKKISEQFPFVEFGILLSRKRAGQPEYPDMDWLKELHVVSPGMQLSAHICGERVREAMAGNGAFINELGPVLDMFQRVQFNFAGKAIVCDDDLVIPLLDRLGEKEVIFPFSTENKGLVVKLTKNDAFTAILFDDSFGKGLLPGEWAIAPDGYHCGYAGGLAEENLMEQLPLIHAASGAMPVWIDLQSGARTNGEFDLDKVRRILHICDTFMRSKVPPKSKVPYVWPLTLLSAEILGQMDPGAQIATGEADEPALFTQQIRWVAVRGEGIPDWAIYYHTLDKDAEFILQQGEKVESEHVIRKFVPCTDDAFAQYRL